MSEWTRIIEAAGLAQGPGQAAGRALLLECWESTSPVEHARRCVLAHYLADTETDLDAEIAWDVRALEEHRFMADADLAPLGIGSAAGFLPSLELNLADGYHRRGEPDRAREHLDRGRAAVDALGDDGYGTMIRRGLDALERRMADPVATDG